MYFYLILYYLLVYEIKSMGKKQGISYRTAWNWFKSNSLPVKSFQTPSGTILVEETNFVKEKTEIFVDIYARVSSSIKKQDLENQVKLCEQYCISKGYIINKIYKDIASGMNDNRPKLISIFNNPSNKLIILYKDRLTRFGFNYINLLLKSKNCELEVINNNKTEEEDLLKDFIAIITSFCCRLYGARRGQSKALNIKNELKTN